MTGVCLIIQGTLTIETSFQHHSDITNGRIIDLLGRDSNSETQWQGVDSETKLFIIINCWVCQRWPRIQFDSCIPNGIVQITLE